MYRIKIFSIGKTKEKWLEEALKEYLKRLTQTASIDFILAKNNEQLTSLIKNEATRGTLIICLDANGQVLDSDQFSSYLIRQLEMGGSRLSLVIGGSEGLPEKFKQTYPLLSLSKLTFTHQIIRLILVEQIYRALEISKGSKYHK